MQWRVMVELSGADGSVQTHEVHGGGCLPAVCSAETLGLTQAQAKQLLAELQRHLVQAQMEEYCRSRRRCPRCGMQRPLKDRRLRQLRSLFGVVRVRAPRFAPCRCSMGHRQTLSPVGEIMPDRCTSEYERTLAKMGARLPYRRARALLDDLFPLGTPPVVETLRQRTLQVGARLDCQAATPSRSTPVVAAGSITLSIDTGHIRAVPTCQVRTFEIIVAQASNDNGKHMVFASVPDEAYHQAQQLRGVLHELGATQTTPVTILSDGAAGPRAVGEAASLGVNQHPNGTLPKCLITLWFVLLNLFALGSRSAPIGTLGRTKFVLLYQCVRAVRRRGPTSGPIHRLAVPARRRRARMTRQS